MLDKYRKPETLEEMLENKAIEHIEEKCKKITDETCNLIRLNLEMKSVQLEYSKHHFDGYANRIEAIDKKIADKLDTISRMHLYLEGYCTACISFFDWDADGVREHLKQHGFITDDIERWFL